MQYYRIVQHGTSSKIATNTDHDSLQCMKTVRVSNYFIDHIVFILHAAHAGIPVIILFISMPS